MISFVKSVLDRAKSIQSKSLYMYRYTGNKLADFFDNRLRTLSMDRYYMHTYKFDDYKYNSDINKIRKRSKRMSDYK